MSQVEGGSYRRAASRIFWGDALADAVPRELDRAGVRRVAVVCGTRTARDPVTRRALEALVPHRVAVFDRVRAHSPAAVVQDLTDLLARERADAVLAVGGGSAIVTARAAALGLAGDRVVPHAFVWLTTPTTAAGTAGAAVTTPGHLERSASFAPATRPRAVFVPGPDDRPALPPEVVGPAMLTTLAMALEGLVSTGATYFTTAALTGAARLLATALAEPAQDGPPTGVYLAALDVGTHAELAGCGLGAALAHTVGHVLGTANGVVDGIVLPRVLATVASARPHVAARLEELLGTTDVSAWFDAVLQRWGLPRRLADLGAAPSQLPDLARVALADHAVRTSPVPVDESLALSVLERSW